MPDFLVFGYVAPSKSATCGGTLPLLAFLNVYNILNLMYLLTWVFRIGASILCAGERLSGRASRSSRAPARCSVPQHARRPLAGPLPSIRPKQTRTLFKMV
jgi:hypothetical protein